MSISPYKPVYKSELHSCSLHVEGAHRDFVDNYLLESDNYLKIPYAK